jgi:hypothetical protein
MKRPLAAALLLCTLAVTWTTAAPPHIASVTYQDTGSVIVSWDGTAGGTFALSRSDESAFDWVTVADGLTDMTYTDTVGSAIWAWYRVEEESSDLLRLTGILPGAGGFIITWDGGSSNSTFTVSRSDLNLTNWVELAAGLTTPAYTDATASASFSYYRVEAMDGPPPPAVYFSDDLETGGEPGWTEVVYGGNTNTRWEVGRPMNVGPPAANSGVNVYGTNLRSDYQINADIGLQTPVIDLTEASSVVLRFATHYETESFFDTIRVYVKDAAGTADLLPDPIYLNSGIQDEWTDIELPVPGSVLGQPLRFEFRFASDGSSNGAGWYIDDIEVGETE